MKKANAEIRAAMQEKHIPAWMIGSALGVHENTVLRRLRFELPEPEKQQIFRIIDELAERSDTTEEKRAV